MSLYLGHIDSTPVLHITWSATPFTTIKSLSPLANTSFHSSSKFATAVLRHTITSYNSAPIIAYNPTRYLSMHRMDLPTTIRDELRAGTSKTYIMICTHPITGYNFVINPAYSTIALHTNYYRYVWDGQFEITTSVNDDAPDEYYIANVSNYGTEISYFSGNSTLYIYEIIYHTPSLTGGIRIGNGDIILGDKNLTDYQYFNLFINNTIDTVYNVGGLTLQVLNSKLNENNYYGLILENDAIKARIDNVDHILFGGGQKNTTNVRYETTYNNVNNQIINTDVSDSLIFVSNFTYDTDTNADGTYSGILPEENNTPVVSFVMAGNQSWGFDIFLYQDPIYPDGAYLYFTYDHTTKSMSITGYSWYDSSYTDWNTRFSCDIKVLK